MPVHDQLVDGAGIVALPSANAHTTGIVLSKLTVAVPAVVHAKRSCTDGREGTDTPYCELFTNDKVYTAAGVGEGVGSGVGVGVAPIVSVVDAVTVPTDDVAVAFSEVAPAACATTSKLRASPPSGTLPVHVKVSASRMPSELYSWSISSTEVTPASQGEAWRKSSNVAKPHEANASSLLS